jgi:hypothetical protein
MKRWTEKEFDSVIEHMPRLAENTVKACREVLVNGLTGAEASRITGVLPPHISRALAKLGVKREELHENLLNQAKSLKVMNNAASIDSILRVAAMEAARSIKGQDWIIRQAQPGQTYEGNGVVMTGGYFVQDVGRVGVLHHVHNLNVEPILGKRIEIQYSEQGKGVLSEISMDKGTREKSR